MNQLRILVFEDRNEVAASWADAIRDGLGVGAVDVESATHDSFERLQNVTNLRRSEWRKDGHGNGMVGEHEADGKDVAVVDYDLLEYSTTYNPTGSRLAYLLRCFTTCGFIVVLNAQRLNIFDLSLRSPSEDFADLHIDGQQLGNPGLWRAEFSGYRPWHWPAIPGAGENFKRCVDDVRDHFEEPVFDFFGLDRVIDAVPWRVHEFLTPRGDPVEKVTFRDFIKRSDAGKEAKDELILDQLCRVAASRIVTLLNSVILPDQNALVDAPHLASRFPSLIKDRSETIESWNRLCNPTSWDVIGLLDERLKQYQFKQPHWLWRPAWYWPEINRDECIEEVRDPWKSGEANAKWVFCENVSKFLPIECVQPFRALVSPPYMKRFLLNRHSDVAAEFIPELGSEGILNPLGVTNAPEAMLSY